MLENIFYAARAVGIAVCLYILAKGYGIFPEKPPKRPRACCKDCKHYSGDWYEEVYCDIDPFGRRYPRPYCHDFVRWDEKEEHQ